MAALARSTAAVLLLLGCGSPGPCADVPREDGGCPDLSFSGQQYDELGSVEMPAVTEELGDARYPACNDDEPCNGPDLDGFGATDVWLLPGVDPGQALIGYRQGTETAVVFLRQGLDPGRVPGLGTGSGG